MQYIVQILKYCFQLSQQCLFYNILIFYIYKSFYFMSQCTHMQAPEQNQYYSQRVYWFALHHTTNVPTTYCQQLWCSGSMDHLAGIIPMKSLQMEMDHGDPLPAISVFRAPLWDPAAARWKNASYFLFSINTGDISAYKTWSTYKSLSEID